MKKFDFSFFLYIESKDLIYINYFSIVTFDKLSSVVAYTRYRWQTSNNNSSNVKDHRLLQINTRLDLIDCLKQQQ